MATVTALQSKPEPPRIVFQVDWKGYVAIGAALQDQPIRMTYHRGRLEIMTVSHLHEWAKKVLGRLVESLTEELNIEIHSGGSTTFRDEDVDAGLEPDECYWIQNERAMRARSEYDPDVDPPPDLAIEVE